MRPNRYHYVVVVAATSERVIVHDPARAPFHVLSHLEFDRAWSAGGRWALLVLPGDERGVSAPPASLAAAAIDGTPATGTCGRLVETLVAQAKGGDLAGAETGLLAAATLCPRDPAPWRELAGVRFLQARWGEAGQLAERAARLDPHDAQGWDLLATSRFLNDEPARALSSWNRIGRPAVDVIGVTGVARTRHPVVVDVVGLQPRTLLTAARFGRAQRRLLELPSASMARLGYRPIDGGLAQIDAVVAERPTVPRGAVPIAALAARTAVHRELRLDVAAPTGSGELWTVAWRWWQARPRLVFGLAVPSVAGLPGVTTIEGLWERASYAAPGPARESAAVVAQERRRASVGIADWATSALRWKLGVALDRWDTAGHAAVDAGLDLRLARDHVAIGFDTGAWVPTGPGRRFALTGLSYAARSTTDSRYAAWRATAGLVHATAGAPFDLWPGAGTGIARQPLVRAHPLLDDGVVAGPLFGRRLAHGSVEYEQPLRALPVGAIGIAVFADAARTWERTSRVAGSWHADLGAGVRVSLPGKGGTLRADLARGLRDGRLVVSAGWLPPWPGR